MKNLKKRSLKAFLWDFAGTLGNRGIAFVTSIFLARLLTPAEFGIVGMAMAFVSIFQIFSDVGFTKALIQSQRNTSITYSSIFYVNIVIGTLLTFVTYFLAPLVALFYENEVITQVLRFLSVLFILSAFNSVQQTILEKQLNMKVLNIRRISAQVLAGIVGVTFAFLGFGVYSLVIQFITASIFTTVFLWVVTNWYPKWEFSLSEVKRLFSFSAYFFLDRLISRIFREINTLFIGKFFSASTLGYFSRADTLRKLIIRLSSTSLRKVFFPVLSELQDDDEAFKRVYYKLIAVTSFISFGLTGFLFIIGDTLIIGLFGNQWEPSIIIFQILVLNSFTYPISVLIGNSFLSRGKSKQMFYISTFRKVFRIVPLFVGYFYGLLPFVISMAVLGFLVCIFNILMVKIYNDLSFWNHFKWLLEGIVSIGIFIIPYIIFLKETSILIEVAYSFMFAISYILISYLRRHEGIVFLINNSKEILKSRSL